MGRQIKRSKTMQKMYTIVPKFGPGRFVRHEGAQAAILDFDADRIADS